MVNTFTSNMCAVTSYLVMKVTQPSLKEKYAKKFLFFMPEEKNQSDVGAYSKNAKLVVINNA